MNIDSILTEWCFRLPKGYPSKSKDYEVLYDVLIETCNCTTDQARQIVERAKGDIKRIVIESLEENSIENQFLASAIQRVNKTEAFKQFLNFLPVEADLVTLNFLNNLSQENSIEFANLLYSINTIDEQSLSKINFQSGLLGQLFNLRPGGMGKGEILLAALIQGSEIQGGGKSYDLEQAGQRYEVKDYSNPKKPNASIRLGTKGTVTRFKFWDEITMTFQRLAQLRGKDSPKFDLDKLLPEELLEAIRYLEDRKEFILAGNLNMTDKKYLDKFYVEANKISSDIQGYTNVILRGPNATPIEMSIEPITDASGDAFVIRPIKDESRSLVYINTELRRLKYVRDPYDLDRDMNAAVQATIQGLTFIVFRRDRINVTRDLRYVVVDSGKIRIIEKDVIPPENETDLLGEE
jgi:hypothetical protein